MQDATVILPPITTSYYSGSLEPQMLTHRTANIGYIYVDSEDPVNVTSPVSMVVSDQNGVNNFFSGLLGQNVRRLSINQIGLNWVSPNVIDGFNNQVIFTIGPTTYTAEIPEGFYTASALAAEMVTQMDLATAGVPLTWTITAVSAGASLPTYSIVNSGPSPFAFVLTGSAVANGKQTFGLSVIQTQLATQYMSPGLWYTRYVDFCSGRLTSHQKIPGRATNRTGDILARFWLPGLVDPAQKNPFVVSEITPTGINWDFHDSISSFDIQIRDEYGNLLLLGTDLLGNGNGFAWSLNIRLEF